MRLALLAAAMAAVISAGSTSTARADVVAFDFTAATGFINASASSDLGFEFIPTTDLLVTTLLMWDYLSNDFGTFDGDVAIWKVGSPNPTTPVVSGAITAAGSPTVASAFSGGTWRAVDVPDTKIFAGVTYRIAGDGFLSPDLFHTHVTPVLNGIALTTTTAYFGASGATAAANYPGSTVNSALAPLGLVSFTYATAVPEAGSLLLVGLVAAGAGCSCLWRGARASRSLSANQDAA
jgi:hypothetical protein